MGNGNGAAAGTRMVRLSFGRHQKAGGARSFSPRSALLTLLLVGLFGSAVGGQQTTPPREVAVRPFGVAGGGQEAIPPREVKVLPVFFVPKGESTPTDDQTHRLMKHLDWARDRYRELLGGQITFTIAESQPRIYMAEQALAFYRAQPGASVPQMASELLAKLKCTRYNCPYVLLVLVMNPEDDFPRGGGQPLNGGINTGGGVVGLSSFALDKIPNFQSTLQHELGHSFGLPHVDVYGYSMNSNDSIMSYNPRHHTNGFTPSRTPGRFIPEDRRGLALNQRVFPGLVFDPKRDVPPGYQMARIVPLGPMKIPGQPVGLEVTTDSGQDFGSKVSNIVQGRIAPNRKAGQVTFDPKTMWQSTKSASGWVSVQITSPYEIDLTRVTVHSQHSGEYHIARAVRIAVRDSGGRVRQVASTALKSADDTVAFPKTRARLWRFEFQAGESGIVVLRGLQFFSDSDELFPPLVPYRE